MEIGKPNDSVMLDESARLETFKRVQWPFLEDSSCTPDKMAEAGFYACGGENAPDSVRCYFCRKELDGWEPEDDPWKEHAKHARGNCAFVNLGKKPAELTVEDVLSLEADRARCLVQMMHQKWAKLFEERMQETRREIDALAPKSKPDKRKTKAK